MHVLTHPSVAVCSVHGSILWQLFVTFQLQSLARASFDIRQCPISLIALYCDWLAMSSYVFQFCGPEGIALANPGRARTRPASRPAELIFEDPARQPAAPTEIRIRKRGAGAAQTGSGSRQAAPPPPPPPSKISFAPQAIGVRPQATASHCSRTPRQQPRRPTASPPDRPPGQWQAPAQRPQLPTPTVPPGMFQAPAAAFPPRPPAVQPSTPPYHNWRMPWTTASTAGKATTTAEAKSLCTAAKSSWPRKMQDPTEEGTGKASSCSSTSRTQSCTSSGT